MMSILKDCLEYIADEYQIQIRVSKETLEKILKDSCIKNQYETHSAASSYTSTDMKHRTELEKILMNVPEDSELRPTYGYLGGENFGGGDVDEYGNIVIVLKDSIKKYSTFCYGDSYNMYENVDISNFHVSRFSDIDQRCVQKAFQDDIPGMWNNIDALHEYFEVQIMKKVTIDDIEKVVYLDDDAEYTIQELKEKIMTK